MSKIGRAFPPSPGPATPGHASGQARGQAREETIVDFLLRRQNGDFIPTSTRVSKLHRRNHAIARAYSTRADAERYAIRGVAVVMRRATLFWIEP